MLGRPFRFLQASDFHLDQPPHGLAEVPDHLLELLADAPYRAATRVFDLALSEEVDFVLLDGGLVDPHRAGPRGLKFLGEQFARLAEREIAVYWATSKSDAREQWPSNLRWPPNLHLFPGGRVERLVHARRGEPVCQIAGYSMDAASMIDHEALPSALRDELAAGSRSDLVAIVVAPHKLDPSMLAEMPVRYWAFGGDSTGSTLLDLADPQRTARLSGSPQGRSPDATGPHGCTIVRVDESGRFRVDPMPTDVVRWLNERLEVTSTMTRSELDHLLHERFKDVIAATPDRALLIRWTLVGEGPLLATARRMGLAAELASSLRVDYGFRSPAAWTISVDIEPPALPAHWYEQETLLGDFVRAIRGHERSDAPLDIRAYLSEQQFNSPLAGYGAVVEPAVRRSILQQAAWLGSDLLRSDDADAKEPAR
jgi:DNA repair protein SbcD/Mre11